MIKGRGMMFLDGDFRHPLEKRARNDGGGIWAREQSARVAWRHLLLWADAALSAVDAGLYTLNEAFFAHTIIQTPGGGRLTAVDAVNAVRRLSAGRVEES